MLPVDITRDHIFVRTPYEKREYVSQILNGVWQKSMGMYRFPKNYYVFRELLAAFPQLEMNPRFMQAYERITKARINFPQLKMREDAPGDPRLRPYQRVDVQYLKKLKCAGIFNEPRTGKTPTTIVLLQELGEEAVANIVICPASLIVNWQKEFKRWAPEIETFLVTGTPKKRERIYQAYREHQSQKVLIISKDTWKLDLKNWEGFEFDVVVVDEAHYLRALAGARRKHTAQAQAVCAVKAKRRYALTGTPTVRHTADIYGILHFLYPEKFNSYWQFVERYFDVYQDNWSGGYVVGGVKPHRQQELQELIGFLSVQRKRSEVMQWLPAKQRIPFYVCMSEKQRKLYDQMLQDFMAVDEETDTVIDTANVLAQLTRLRQICLDPKLLGFNCPSAKTEALLEWLEDNPEPVVIMSMFTSYLHLLKPQIEAQGRRVGMIIGEMNNQAKDQTVRDFQEGKLDVVLCNIISAGVGFTLDRAETIIFTDLAWNPADNEQAEDRITPTTEERNHSHNIIVFQCDGTVDTAINRILEAKKSLTDIINEGGKKAIEQLFKGEP